MSILTGVTVLLSYAYAKGKGMPYVIEAAAEGAEVVIDSGAFTAWRAGKSIDLPSYAAFLRELPFKPLFAVTLDVVGNPKATRENTERLRDLGATVVPVVTRGTDTDAIRRIVEGEDVVALGGLVGTPRNAEYVKHVMETVPGVKWHWLGFSNTALVAKYRPYSCDITTWYASLRRGIVIVYAGHGQRVTLANHAFSRRPTPRVEALLRSYGYTGRDLSRIIDWRGEGSVAQTLSAQSFLRYARDVRRAHGTRIAFALSPSQVRVLERAQARELALLGPRKEVV